MRGIVHLHYKRTVMEEKNWMLLMEDLSEIRLLSSLILKKARKGAAATAQEVDMLFRVALAKDPIVPGELSHDMGISKTTVSLSLIHIFRWLPAAISAGRRM